MFEGFSGRSSAHKVFCLNFGNCNHKLFQYQWFCDTNCVCMLMMIWMMYFHRYLLVHHTAWRGQLRPQKVNHPTGPAPFVWIYISVHLKLSSHFSDRTVRGFPPIESHRCVWIKQYLSLALLLHWGLEESRHMYESPAMLHQIMYLTPRFNTPHDTCASPALCCVSLYFYANLCTD